MIPNVQKYKPLYEQLLGHDLRNEKGKLVPFFCQAGDRYLKTKARILFVGKSVNGWVTTSRNVDRLFDKSTKDHIVNREDQLEWVKNLEGPNEVYNTKKSAFWRVIKGISAQLLDSEECGLVEKEVHWYPGSLEETVELARRLLYEYYGIEASDRLLSCADSSRKSCPLDASGLGYGAFVQ